MDTPHDVGIAHCRGLRTCDLIGGVDFAPSAVAADYTARMRAFLDEEVLPAEASYDAFRAERRGTPEEFEAHRDEIAGRIVLVRHELMFEIGRAHV